MLLQAASSGMVTKVKLRSHVQESNIKERRRGPAYEKGEKSVFDFHRERRRKFTKLLHRIPNATIFERLCRFFCVSILIAMEKIRLLFSQSTS